MVYFDALLKRDAASFAAMLWAVRNASALPSLPGGVAARRDPGVTDEAYAAMGYRVLGARVLRVDKVERLAAEARRLARQGPFGPTPELAALAGSSLHDLAATLTSLAYRAVHDGNGVTFHARREPRRRAATGHAPRADSPFAKLATLRLAQ
jgi:ATP-dependent RNA helicase SUPV3L1/SUV3